jgi:hypothetical protein
VAEAEELAQVAHEAIMAPVSLRTLAELSAAGKDATVIGAQALTVARRMDSALSSGSEVAALSRELSRLMLIAVGKGSAEADPVDEVKRKREEKLSKARASSA